MAFSRESLNLAVSDKLADIDSASGMHKGLFSVTQLGGLAAAVGAILIAPVALEVAAIAGVAGLATYGISQLLQSKRLGRYMPLPGVPVSAQQFAYLPSVLVAQVMGSAAPAASAEVDIIPQDWLPQRERRISYLLTYAPDILIAAAETAQTGISFAAIVDSAVRASEYAITDEQINNPVVALKLRGDVRALIQGDTSKLEAQQRTAIQGEWERAQRAHAAGELEAGELEAIEAEVMAIAPDVVNGDAASGDAAIIAPAAVNTEGYRTDWRDVFALIKDQNTYPAVVVIGPQGLGKTTLVEYLLSTLKRNKIVLDPHYQAGAWPGCRVVGAAMNYRAISAALANISADVAERYKQRATYKGYKPAPVALVLEEQTNWASKVDGAGKFLKESLSDIRKAGYQTISVAHSDTNTARGGAIGTSKMRREGELKIVLLEKGLAEISLKGREVFRLRYPDPTPYTVSMGEPDVAKDGSLGPEFCGTDTPADGEGWGSGNGLIGDCTQSALDVATVEVAAAPGEQAQFTRWDKFRQASADHEHMVALANWLERRAGDSFSVRSLKKDKTVTAAFKDADANIVAGLNTFVHYGFVAKLSEGAYRIVTPN